MSNHQAFLVGSLDLSTSPPTFIGCEILSESAGDACLSTTRRFLFDVAESYGASFGEARDRLLVDVAARPLLAWALDHLPGRKS